MRDRTSLRSALQLGAVTLALAVSPALASACPSCESGRLVRAALWGSPWLENSLLIALPFALVGALAALLHRIGAPRATRRETRS